MFDVGTTVILSSPLIHHRNGARSPGPSVTAPAQPGRAQALGLCQGTGLMKIHNGHRTLTLILNVVNAGRVICINLKHWR